MVGVKEVGLGYQSCVFLGLRVPRIHGTHVLSCGGSFINLDGCQFFSFHVTTPLPHGGLEYKERQVKIILKLHEYKRRANSILAYKKSRGSQVYQVGAQHEVVIILNDPTHYAF